MGQEDPPPDELRCKRTDGRGWRCKRLASGGRLLCDIHHLQGKLRANKEKVPDSLKLERGVRKKRVNKDGESSVRALKKAKMQLGVVEKRRRRGVSEALDKALKRMKLKRGDLQLELIRVFLKRQVEKKKDKELKENAVEEETRELPYGVMAISQSSSSMQKLCESGGLDVKVGADLPGNLFLQRHFRSKNIEPLPISTTKVVPFAENLKKKKIKKCHFCRETKRGCLIKCMACKKRFFCGQCIKERHFSKQDVKVRCPACCGTCNCKLCMKQPVRVYNHEGCYRDGTKRDRKHLLHYLIHMLLPVLKKVNFDHIHELEKESRLTGEEQSEIRIPQIKLGFLTSEFCNKCKSSIVDYHRTCSNCSYNLCLSCCRKISEISSSKDLNLVRCKKRRIRSSGDDFSVRENTVREISHRPICLPGMLQNWTTTEDGCIPCPPADIGGCGESSLRLRCMFPFNWTRDLEVRAEEILCSYQFPESRDISSLCVLCKEMVSANSGDKLQRELSRRIGSDDSHLYCPTLKDLHLEKLEHFQSHWGKGHPVVVRNVLRSTSGLCWDPVSMLCSYMENKCSESCKKTGTGAESTNCLDWCEVEIGRRRIFMGSLEKRRHASVRQKFLKFKARLSSHLFRKQFPVHYNEIVGALPLPEYVHPVSGLLNVGLKCRENLPKPDLGPSIFLSFGDPEELNQSECLSKLSYESHDTVNILVHATAAAISPDQISRVQSLTKKFMAQDNLHVQSSSNSSNRKGKSSLQSDDTGESSLQEIGGMIQLPNGIKNKPFHSSTDKCQARDVENGNPSDGSESDAQESILCWESIDKSDPNEHKDENIESSIFGEGKQQDTSCGAQWDIFPQQDVPKLQEYLRRHSNELSSTCNLSKLVHPILDGNFFLDAYHKLKLKEEFDVQPWTFEQHTGEAIFIPAGCPFQIKKVKSCVNVVLDFISPENASRCVQLNDEIRLLPSWHKVKSKAMEVEKMALQGISAAIEDICNLLPDQDR